MLAFLRNLAGVKMDKAAQAGARSFAISSVFSPVNAEFELRAAEIIAEQYPGSPVSLSHEIGRMGLLGRENATVINAALRELADHVTTGLTQTVTASGITAPVFLSQNDGTLMDVDYARRYPVATFASGPTNSMRGAAFLSGLRDCAVVDVGGTTTDVGILQNGFPRQATADVSVAADLSVADGHTVAKEVRHQLAHHLPHLGGVSVHVDPYGQGGDVFHRIHEHAHDGLPGHSHD